MLQQVKQKALERLERECQEKQRGTLFSWLRETLAAPVGAIPRPAGIEALKMTDQALKVVEKRLRKRLHEIAREELAASGTPPDEIEARLRGLFGIRAPPQC
jgi:primosomal protein N''